MRLLFRSLFCYPRRLYAAFDSDISVSRKALTPLLLGPGVRALTSVALHQWEGTVLFKVMSSLDWQRCLPPPLRWHSKPAAHVLRVRRNSLEKMEPWTGQRGLYEVLPGASFSVGRPTARWVRTPCRILSGIFRRRMRVGWLTGEVLALVRLREWTWRIHLKIIEMFHYTTRSWEQAGKTQRVPCSIRPPPFICCDASVLSASLIDLTLLIRHLKSSPHCSNVIGNNTGSTQLLGDVSPVWLAAMSLQHFTWAEVLRHSPAGWEAKTEAAAISLVTEYLKGS